MKNIYKKLEIPAPSAGFEARIIAAANAPTRSYWRGVASITACLLIVFAVALKNPTPANYDIDGVGMLDDIDFYSDQYGFDADIS